MKKQLTETIYGKTAQDTATQRMHELFEANDYTAQHQHEVASPYADWSVEPVDGGWAVFVTEPQ